MFGSKSGKGMEIILIKYMFGSQEEERNFKNLPFYP
jgi:hypothetical protein